MRTRPKRLAPNSITSRRVLLCRLVAIVGSLPIGTYAAILSDAASATGIGVVVVFDAELSKQMVLSTLV